MIRKECKTTVTTYGNVWVRTMMFEKKDEIKKGHIHNHDHITLCVLGSADIYNPINGEKIGEIKKGESFEVPKGEAHSVISKENNTVCLCLEALRDCDNVIETDLKNNKEIKKRIITWQKLKERTKGF